MVAVHLSDEGPIEGEEARRRVPLRHAPGNMAHGGKRKVVNPRIWIPMKDIDKKVNEKKKTLDETK
jgi:hypothetical protein